jgi:RNA polymerase sigma-70 factor (ECF subfamily)
MAGQVRRRPDELAAARATSRDELARVYAAYRPWAVRWIAARLRDGHQHAAEDLAQNTFLRVWPRLAGVGAEPEREGRLYGLLATIARGEIADHYRRGPGPQHAAEYPVADDSWIWNSPRHATGAAAEAPAGQTASRLWGALEQLPARTRHAVELHIAHGMSQSAAAQEMQCDKCTVRRHAHAGVAALREQLATTSPQQATPDTTALPLSGAPRAVQEAHEHLAEQDQDQRGGRSWPTARDGRADPMTRARRAVAQVRGQQAGRAHHAAQAEAHTREIRWQTQDQTAYQDRERTAERGTTI